MNGKQGTVAGWGALGGAVTIFLNQMIAWAWSLVHLPVLAAPSAEFYGAEQIVVATLFALWAAREKIEPPNGGKPA